MATYTKTKTETTRIVSGATLATHTLTLSASNVMASSDTVALPAMSLTAKYNTSANSRAGINDDVLFQGININGVGYQIRASQSSGASARIKYVGANVAASWPLYLMRTGGTALDDIVSTLKTSDLFNASNKTSRTFGFPAVSLTTNISTCTSAGQPVAYGSWVNTPESWGGDFFTVTLNAPPTCDATDVTLSRFPAYAGYTQATVTISNLSAKYGGDISSAVLKIGNATSSSRTTDGTLSLELTEAGTFTPQVIVTDSRGQITTKNLAQITVLPYVLPSTSFSVIRTSSTGEEEDEGKSAVITATYNFTSAVASLSAPAISVKDQSGITVSPTVTWYANRALTTPISDWSTVLTGSTVYALLDNANHDLFNTQYSYQIGITPNDIDVNSDTHSGTTITQILGSAFYTMDFLAGGHGIAFGKAATNEGFECGMETTFNDTVLFEDDIQAIGAATFSDTVLFEEDIEADKDIHLGLPDYQTADTTDKALYDAIVALGWQDVLES